MMNDNPGERMGAEPIASEKVLNDRKIFFLDLKENQRGRFLKITEDVGGRRDTVMLPAAAFKDFLEALQRLVEYEATLD
ncbi:MAG: DNA-binding protein [Verrucomicrobia bacterium]|nr:DNA-binding protein [Verrucomicrobiota bacterium]